MQKIFIVYVEEEGEIEGAFDEEGNLLHWWCCNDASWRNEYFSPLMKQLGYEFVHSDDEVLEAKLIEVTEGF